MRRLYGNFKDFAVNYYLKIEFNINDFIKFEDCGSL